MPSQPLDRGTRVAKYVVIAVGVLVGATGLVATFLPRPAPEISWQVIAIQFGDPTQAIVTFDVDKPPLATAECQLTATGSRRDIVNRLDGVVIGATPGKRVSRHRVAVPTDQLATGAAISQCVIVRRR